MLEEDASLGQFTGQIIGHDINLHLELLGDGVLDVLVELPVPVQEPNEVGALVSHLTHATHHHAHSLLLLGAASSDVLHGHEYLVDAGDVLLDFGDVVLEHGHLDALGTAQSLHDRSVLVPDVLLDHALQGLHLVDPVVQTHDLGDQLRSLWHYTRMDRSVYQVKTGAEGFFHSRDSMQLGIVRTHNCAIIAYQLLT